MADESSNKFVRCEYHLFMVFCVIGLAFQIWLLASEFTQSSLPLITKDTGDEQVLPAITVCIPIEFSVSKSEFLNYLAQILESPAYEKELKDYMSSFYYDIYQKCKSRLEQGKLENM